WEYTRKRSFSRSIATRRCISPCPHKTMSWVRGLCTMVSEGSSSLRRISAWPSLTSSLRSVAAIDIDSTAGVGSTLISACGAVLPPRTELAERDGIAGLRRRALGVLGTVDAEDAGDAAALARG